MQEEKEPVQDTCVGLLLDIMESLKEQLVVVYICPIKGSYDQACGQFQERSKYGSGLHDCCQKTGVQNNGIAL